MFKTGLLLAAMTGLFLAVGYAVGGQQGMAVALVIAGVMNFSSYWFSDKIVLSLYRAQPLDEGSNPRLYRLITRLAHRAGIPMPKAYIIENLQPNAFATGRSPAHGAVALTTGLIAMLDERELGAVIAHELGHIKNRDTLTMTMTATIAGAIGMLGNMMMFGMGSRERAHPALGIVMMIVAPLAAMLVQMAISRTREYAADASGAETCDDPLALASALRKISAGAERYRNPQAEQNPATAHMFIMNPLHGSGMDNLFSTHPSAENRIRALEKMAALKAPRAPEGRMKKGSFDFN